MTRLQIIVGSTREGRAADKVVPWVMRHAEAHGGFEVELIDLRDWPLPFFQETFATIGDRNDPTYSDVRVRQWNKKIAQGEAYLFITPEYNHSVPGVLKNAIDNVFVSYAFRNKPAGFVGYSAGPIGAARAVEHLAHIVLEAEMVSLRNSVLVAGVQGAFAESGEVRDARAGAALGILLDDLAWWGTLLKEGRARGQLPPGNARLMAAMNAAAKQG